MNSTKILGSKLGPILSGLIVLFVVAPLIVVILMSFTSAEYISFPWEQGWSFRWFTDLINHPDFIKSFGNSVALAAGAAVIAVIVGVPASVAFVRYNFPGRGALTLLGNSPLFIPPLLTGLALLLVFSGLNVRPGPVGLLFGFVAITIPFVLRIVIAALSDFNIDQENAAENLGSTKFKAFLLITLPQIRAGIVSAFIMAFIVAFDSVALAVFFVTPDFEVLPVKLFFYSLNNFDPLAASISVAMIVFSLILIVIVESTFGLEKLFGGGRSAT